MHIVFRKLDDWFKKDPDLKDKYEATYQFIQLAVKSFAKELDKSIEKQVGVHIDLELSEMLLKQALIDAFDDLMRLKEYHLTTDPNRLKEMSYIVFWLLRRKPITLVPETIISNNKLSDLLRVRLLFINESFCINLLLGATFPGPIPRENCVLCVEEGKRQLNYFKKFLLYYLVYRADSPKSIEAILMGTTIFPVWDVDPIIWSPQRDPEVEF